MSITQMTDVNEKLESMQKCILVQISYFVAHINISADKLF